jgi:hypothetical protein
MARLDEYRRLDFAERWHWDEYYTRFAHSAWYTTSLHFNCTNYSDGDEDSLFADSVSFLDDNTIVYGRFVWPLGVHGHHCSLELW